MLEAQSLTRVFGDKRVVDDVSFTVAPGRITGFVGANGAGKTTAMRMLMGVLGITAGEVLWQGTPITAAVRRTFGYMPEERGLYPRMKLRDQLVYFARLHGLSTPDGTSRADSLLGHFGLTERADDLLDTLSLGNQQRVQIAASLVHRPRALVLDEPFSGLDPLAVDSMVDLQYRVELDGDDAAWLRDLRGITVHDTDGPVALLALDGLSAADLTNAVVAHSPVAEVARVRQPLSEIFREVTR